MACKRVGVFSSLIYVVVVLLKVPLFSNSVIFNPSGKSMEELKRLLLLILGCAVQVNCLNLQKSPTHILRPVQEIISASPCLGMPLLFQRKTNTRSLCCKIKHPFRNVPEKLAKIIWLDLLKCVPHNASLFVPTLSSCFLSCSMNG